MKEHRIFKKLVIKSLPLMTNYIKDLLTHDKEQLDKLDNSIPFIHFTRKMGTGLIILSSDNWPARGETIPYIFGTADRNHLLREVKNTANHYKSNCVLIQFYDGNKLHVMSHDEIMCLVDTFQHETISKWSKEK